MGVGLMRSLQPPFFGVYNFIANTSKRVLFLPPSDAYVRSFLYLLYTLIKLYHTHTQRIVWVSLVAQTVKNLPAMQETWVRSLSWEDPLEKGMATHSSMLAWRILKGCC